MNYRTLVRTSLAAIALSLAGQAANAADLASAAGNYAVPPKTAVSRSPWQIRLRALAVVPRNSGNVDGIAGSDLSYSKTVVPELDISYFFTRNIAAELILGTTYSSVYGEGSISALGKLGKTWILPPTLTLQYHFTDLGKFQPYVGAGVNYTVFYNQSGDTASRLHIHNSFGVALQAGFDYMINDHWGANFDVKKLFLRPDFDATVGGVNVSGKAKLDPWLIGTGITYRF